MTKLDKVDMWVAKNPLKYHFYTKSPLIILCLLYTSDAADE